MSNLVKADPIFVAIEKYEDACKTLDAARGKSVIDRAMIDATAAALRELVFTTPPTEEAKTIQREYFTIQTGTLDSSSGVEEVNSVCVLSYLRAQLPQIDIASGRG
jgi:hypothetical protein